MSVEASTGAVYAAIVRSDYDFRTVQSLADELDARPSLVRAALAQLEADGKVRRPVVDARKYDDWYRDVKRGLTRQEKWARLRAIVTFQPMRDDF